MSTLTMAGLRQALASRVSGLGGDWNQAPVPFDAHSWTAVPDAVPASKAHLSYSIGFGKTAAAGSRHRRTDGVRCESEIPIRFLARIAPRDTLTSVDAALAAEVALIQRLDASQWSTDISCYWLRTERASAPTGDWLRIDAYFGIGHLLALA